MASGAGDRVDVTAWIPAARSVPPVRAGWEAAGIAARNGDSAQDQFGAALTAARARDDAAAARARAADVQDRSGSTRAASDRVRQDRIREANRSADRKPAAAGDGAGLPAARDGDDATAASRPERESGTAPAAGARVARDPLGHRDDRTADAAPGDATSASAAPDATADAAASKTEAAVAAAESGDRKAGDADAGDAKAGDANAADTKAADVKAETAAGGTAPQAAAAQDVPATLLALLAALAKGGPAAVTAGAGASGAGGVVSAAATTGTAAAGADRTAGAAAAQAAGSRGAASPAGASAVQAGHGGGAGAEAPAAANFLAALAEAGPGAGQGALPLPPDATAQAAAPDAAAAAATASLAAPAGPSAAAAASAPAAATTQAAPAVPIGQVPMIIGLRSLAGSSEFQIRLDPAELGRIEVKLEIDKARGTVMTHLVVDRADTLAMLQRDSGQLQQALAQTGLDPSGGGISLSLRGDGGARGGGQGDQGGAPRGGRPQWATEVADAPQEGTPMRRLRGYGGLDIRI